jgi:hypothetical protein
MSNRLVIPQSLARMNNLNVGREKHGEENALRIDLDLELEVAAEKVLPSLCAGDWEAFKYALWSPDEEQKVAEPMMSPLKFSNEFTDHKLSFQLHFDEDPRNVLVRDATIKKFVATPQQGGVVLLSLQAQIRSPEIESDLTLYAQGFRHNNIRIAIDPAQQVLNLAVNNEVPDRKSAAAGG